MKKKGNLSINTMIILVLGIIVLAIIIGLIFQWKGDSITIIDTVLTPPELG